LRHAGAARHAGHADDNSSCYSHGGSHQGFLAGVSAQYESEVVYHSIRADLEKQGVIFLDMDSGLRQYPELVKEYFGTVIPAADNKFSALNSAVWSGGSFICVPKNTHVELPPKHRQDDESSCRRVRRRLSGQRNGKDI
jgi:Fe-S cluster assembly scaffold protein SufB